jgi:hypothetical protein
VVDVNSVSIDWLLANAEHVRDKLSVSDGWPTTAKAVQIGGCHFVVDNGQVLQVSIVTIQADWGTFPKIRSSRSTVWHSFPLDQERAEGLLGANGRVIDTLAN